MLVSALVLPGLIFLFLKRFGRNEFLVEPLYQNGLIEVPVACQIKLESPYSIPDSVFERFESKSPLTLVSVPEKNDPDSDELNTNLARVADAIGAGVTITKLSASFSDPAESGKLKKCILLAPPDASVVLMDSARLIRGYYNGSSMKDVDRLIAEILIIQKRF